MSIDSLRNRLKLPESGFWLLGLSGGADSIALLRMLSGSQTLRIEAVHVNHGLRGAESDGDEAFVRKVCEAEGIRLHVYRAELGGRKDEAAAREARYACFRQAAAETGADGILLAHQMDDQAETFLLRLLRGAGAEGLSGMAAESTMRGIRIARPMLDLTRDEIRNMLRENGIPWREDSSNGDGRYLRNRIRSELLPLMESMTPGSAGRICGAMELIRMDQEALDAQAEVIFRAALTHGRLNAGTLGNAPGAVKARILRKWWLSQAPALEERQLSREQTEALTDLAENRKEKVNLPAGYQAQRIGGYLYLIPSGEHEEESPVPVEGADTAFAEWHLLVSGSLGNPGDGKQAQEVPEGFTDGCVIRTRRPGDRIRPFGGCGEKKLQDYLTDRKVPRPWRDRIPLLCRGQEVLLVCGVGAGRVPEWNRETRNIRLTWTGVIPWME